MPTRKINNENISKIVYRLAQTSGIQNIDIRAIEAAGAFAIVLEMVPEDLAATITKELSIPTIGIGAGNQTDAQVLVWTDAFGLNKNPPKLARAYRNLRTELLNGAKEFAADVVSQDFPSAKESFK